MVAKWLLEVKIAMGVTPVPISVSRIQLVILAAIFYFVTRYLNLPLGSYSMQAEIRLPA